MIERSAGIILRLRPLTETSLIVHWLTPELGRLSTIAKGARRPKSPFRGRLDLLYLADFSFNRSRASELHTLSEVNVRETHSFFRTDIGLLRQAAYCVRLIEQATETETPLPAVFEMLKSFLATLAAPPAQPQRVFGFELKLLAELGLQPDLSQARLSGGAKALIGQLEKMDWRALARLRLNEAQENELRHFLHGFLVFHLGRIPKGRDAALAVGTQC